MTPAPSREAETPSGNDLVTMAACPVCGRDYKPTGRRRHCSDACRVAAWRRRHAPPPVPAVPLPPKGRRRAVTVYECDTCGERALGSQRCDECRVFMRRVGIGGCCPACDTPISAAELLAPP